MEVVYQMVNVYVDGNVQDQIQSTLQKVYFKNESKLNTVQLTVTTHFGIVIQSVSNQKLQQLPQLINPENVTTDVK